MTARRRYLAAFLRRQHGRHRAPQVIVPPRMPCRHGLFGCDHCRPTYQTGVATRTALMTPTLLMPTQPTPYPDPTPHPTGPGGPR